MPTHLAIAWYKPWEWKRLREVAADPERMEATHAEWLRSAKKVLHELQRQGYEPHRVLVGVDELVAWCAEQGLPINGDARSRFAAAKHYRTLPGHETAPPGTSVEAPPEES